MRGTSGALHRLIAGAALSATCAFLVAVASGGTSAQWIPGTPQFQPAFDVRLCNALSASFDGPAILQGGGPDCAPDTAPGGNPDLSAIVSVPPGHHNVVPDYLVATLDDAFAVADDAAVPDGTVVGGLRRAIGVGLDNAPCSAVASSEFILYDATTDITSVFSVQSEGTLDRFSTLAADGGDSFDGKADSNSPVVSHYPDISNRYFDPDADGVDTDGNPATVGDQPVRPHARYAGLTQLPAAGGWQLAQLFVFEPGELAVAFSANAGSRTHPFAKLTGGSTSLVDFGYTTIVVLNDPTEARPSPSSVNDFCSPLSLETALLGRVDTDGDTSPDTNRLTAAVWYGGYKASIRTQSLRDNDGDGIENALDTCPGTANSGDPYADAGPDGDMLDSACDPTPSADTNFGDHDGDGLANAADNCPTISNPLQAESEKTVDSVTASPDGGPQGDEIGDACDPSPTVADGGFFNVLNSDSVCLEGPGRVDNDEDGWCSFDWDALDPDDADPSVPYYTFSLRLPDSTDPDGDDDQSDGCYPCYALADSNQEWAVGTDPLNSCPPVRGLQDTWPPDFQGDGVSNILDLVQLTPPVFNSQPGDPEYIVRKDLNSDGVINILDIVHLTPPVFSTSCPP